MIDKSKGKMEKYILRKAFDTPDSPYLPKDVLWRQKEQFSDGVGYSWIDSLKAYAEEKARLDLAYAIRTSREAKKMTQKAVAHKANMPQSVIARLESGTHSVSVDTLNKVAHALGKQIELV